MHPNVLLNLISILKKTYLILKYRHENEVYRYGTKNYFKQ